MFWLLLQTSPYGAWPMISKSLPELTLGFWAFELVKKHEYYITNAYIYTAELGGSTQLYCFGKPNPHLLSPWENIDFTASKPWISWLSFSSFTKPLANNWSWNKSKALDASFVATLSIKADIFLCYTTCWGWGLVWPPHPSIELLLNFNMTLTFK